MPTMALSAMLTGPGTGMAVPPTSIVVMPMPSAETNAAMTASQK